MENFVISQVENYSQIDSSKCIKFVDKPVVESLFWNFFLMDLNLMMELEQVAYWLILKGKNYVSMQT